MNHDAMQEEIKGDGTPLEQRVTERVLQLVKRFPNQTPGYIKSRLGSYVPETVSDLVIDRLISEGKLNAKPIKFELTIAEGL
jgi:hypothetical protein